MCVTFSLSIDGHLGCFPILAILNIFAFKFTFVCSVYVAFGSFSLFYHSAPFTHTVIPQPQMCRTWHLKSGLMISSGVLEHDEVNFF